MLGLQVAHAAAHVPHDVVFLPVLAERFGEFVVRFVDEGERRLVRAFEAA